MYIKHELSKEEQLSVDILRRAFNGVILIETDTNEIIYMNQSLIDIFGYSADYFIEHGIAILSKNFSQNVLEELLRSVKNGQDVNYVTWIEKENKDIIYFEVRYFLMSKTSKYICGMYKNVTDKVLYRREQKYKDSRLNRFLTTMHKISHSQEFQSGDLTESAKKITKYLSEAIDVDRVSIRLYNEAHDELISLSLYDRKLNQYLKGKHVSREKYSEFFNYIEETPILSINDIDKNEIARKHVSDFFSQDGMIVSMLMTKIIMDGLVQGYIFFQSWNKIEWDRETILFASQIADYVAITILNQKLRKEQELLEQKVKERTEALEVSIQKETQANLAKRRFLSHMSHELRTPLNALIGYLDLVDHTNDPHENEKYIDSMKQGAHDLVSIVDDILDFSKIESGKVVYHPTFIDLKQTMEQVISLYDNHLRRTEVKYTHFIDLFSSTYETDEKLIKQIMHNLLSNAFKFTKKGSIHVNVSELPDIDDTSKKIIIDVRDTGIGIKKQDLERIFESFEQSFSPDLTHPKGAGLGLAITKDLVHILGGAIEVDSSYGQGSSFRVIIPMRCENELLKYKENIESTINPLREQLNILIVEDNEINREILNITLNKANHYVESVSNGYEALLKITEKTFDIVLMDIHMPILDGLETTELLRLNPQFDYLKIIALTANAFEFNDDNYLNFSFCGFLVKPVKQDVLLRYIYDVHYDHKNHLHSINMEESILIYFEKYVKMNIREGLSYIGENETLYINLIKDFLDAHRLTIEQASKAYNEQLYDEFYRSIHTIKGLTKLLGMTEIYNIILSLEEAYKHQLEPYKIKERLESLKILFNSTCYIIEYIFQAFKERGINYGI